MTAQNAPRADLGTQKDETNQLRAAYFAAAIVGLLILFTGFHLVGVITESPSKTSQPFG
jgi:hypothetical protein